MSLSLFKRLLRSRRYIPISLWRQTAITVVTIFVETTFLFFTLGIVVVRITLPFVCWSRKFVDEILIGIYCHLVL